MLDFAELDRRIEHEMRAAHVPGAAVAIVQEQHISYAKGYGVTSVEDGGLLVTPQTIFRIGSTTKPLTGTAIMRLVEAGMLDLDHPVREYIAWFTLSEPGAADRVTVRMLLNNTAGLPTTAEHFGPRDPRGLTAYVREEVSRYPLIAPPGTLWSYSNASINVAGCVAEVVSGIGFTELMQKLVFDPLEMARTTFDPTVAMTFPLAQSHNLESDGTLQVQHRFADNAAGYPGGFAMSTVLDLANFAVMHLNAGSFRHKQILLPQSVAAMHAIQADMYTTTGTGYGLAFVIDTYKGVRRVGHDGGISTFRSKFDMAPEHGVAVVMLINRLAANFAIGSVTDYIFDSLLNLPPERPRLEPATPDTSLWPRYAGTYLGQECGLATIKEVNNHLVLELNGEQRVLHALTKDIFFSQNEAGEETACVGFVPQLGGPTRYITVYGAPCTRIELDPSYQPDPALWKAYSGTFFGGTDQLHIRIVEGRLWIHSKLLGMEVPCTPLEPSRFACTLGVVEMQMLRDSSVPRLKLGSVTYTRERRTRERTTSGR